ncbi:MAG: DEAD/DEAH box helicase family protein [Verrucomicrobiota bacterium]
MNRHVNAIAGRLSLRPPQRHSLELLDRITELVPPRSKADLAAALEAIRKEFPTVTDFEREFPSLCFALATGVGKTRLMGAFISYLHLAHGVNNFFVMAPNLTIYNKLIADFTPNTPKYVFKGIAEFATDAPEIITGDNYEAKAGTLFDQVLRCKVNIFNISKINSEVRGGKSPRIRRLSEYIGESYFDYLAALEDLVLIMDESHRYRASAGVRAINELKPFLGLELTATPFVETTRGPVQFKNVILDYPLGKALTDGFVKEPAVVTQKNFDPKQFTPEQLEQVKLEDGVRLHENTKVELETYARQTEQRMVKPFMLVIAQDTTHAGQLMQLIKSEKFFEGRYKEKVIQVDSSKTGAEEDEMVQRLLAVESPDEPTEIVIHVNMLKEGWDVTNLYTIVPLRAANARILIEQSIGRGLRLPYGRRTGVASVDRLSIIAHDKFKEIVEEANKPDSAIRLQQIILDPDEDLKAKVPVVAQSNIAAQLTPQAPVPALAGSASPPAPLPLFATEAERQVAQVTYEIIKKYDYLPASAALLNDDVQQQMTQLVSETVAPVQKEMEGVIAAPDVAAIVKKTASLVINQTIDIPRILVVPKGEVTTGFDPFKLEVAGINYQPVSRDLLIQYLATHQQETLSGGSNSELELRLENYIVRALVDFDDIHYDDHADLLYDLASQMVAHLRSYLSEDDTRNVLIYHQNQIGNFIHAQMQKHHWEKSAGYEAKVSKGFTELKPCAFTAPLGEKIYDLCHPPSPKSHIPKVVFSGFKRCLYPYLKFQSDSERIVALILDRDETVLKWFKPARGQFHIYYKFGIDHSEYQPDFAAELADCIYMFEIKSREEVKGPQVQAKKDAAIKWCEHATKHALTHGGKKWEYKLIPHDVIAENMTIEGLANVAE